MKTITIGSGNLIDYRYDFTGQRIKYLSNGQEKQYLYDGLTLIAQTNTIGNTIARYHYGDRYQLAETRQGSTNSYFHVDSLGTNVAVTNTDGTIAARYEYDAYGNLLTQSGDSEQPFGFTGYQKDDETGLYYANARYYDSNTGRFLRNDPLEGNIQDTPSLHRYLYANANPTVFVDPTGMGNDTSHYYDALLIGHIVGLNQNESFAFALGAQVADEFIQTDAVRQSSAYAAAEIIGGTVFPEVQEIQARIIRNNCGNHALCNVKPETYRESIKAYVLNGASNYAEVGTADHAYTDSFYHIGKDDLFDPENQMLLTEVIGHLFEWESTDKAYLYHNSKRIKSFKARARLMYNYTVKQGTQKISKTQFEISLNKAVELLDDQYKGLTRRHSELTTVEGGVRTWVTDFSEIDDKEEFDMIADMLTHKGFNNMPRTEKHELGRTINQLLNDFSVDRLRGIALTMDRRDEDMLKHLSKPMLIDYVNNKLFQAQVKSRDAIFNGIAKERGIADTVKENVNNPGVMERSK